MPQVFLPASLRDEAGGVTSLQLRGGTVREVVAALETRFPGMADRLVVDGELRPGWGVSVAGHIARDGLRAKVSEGDEIHFVLALGGG